MTTPLTAEALNELALTLGMPPDTRYVLVGDGSGTVATKASAWACWLLDRQSMQLSFHHGGATLGTNMFAELAPFVHVLWLLEYERGRADVPDTTISRVFIVSDSEVTVRCGQGWYDRNANRALWDALQTLCAQGGFQLVWRHVYRNSNPFNAACDQRAGKVRKVIEEISKEVL